MSQVGMPGNRPRLLVLASTYPRWAGDPEPGFVHELAKRLVDQFDVTVLCPHAAGSAESEVLDGVCVKRYRYAPAAFETLVNNGGIVSNLKQRPWKWLLVPGFLIGLLWCAWWMMRRWQPDAVHAHWLLPQGLVVACLGKLGRVPPLLVTAHGADLFSLRAKPLQALKRFVVRQAAVVTVVSPAMVRELERIDADTTKVEVQPMGVDLIERFTPDPDTSRLPDSLLFVGRLVEKKGLRHLLDAMPLILERHPDASLTVVGFGPEERARRVQSEELGISEKIHFSGAVPQAELPLLYRSARVFVSPFTRAVDGDEEGFGLVSIEAGGCGCHLVLGRMPAVLQTFDGLPGVSMVPGDNPERIANACIEALSGPQIGNELVEILRAKFDWSMSSREYARILHAIRD